LFASNSLNNNAYKQGILSFDNNKRRFIALIFIQKYILDSISFKITINRILFPVKVELLKIKLKRICGVERITLVGQGRGAASVEFLVHSLMVRQTHFKRVILMSGSIFSPWARVENPSEVSLFLYPQRLVYFYTFRG